MDDKDQKKGINLVPDDMRLKELEHLARKKVDDSHDLVHPDKSGLKKPKRGEKTGSEPSWFMRLFKRKGKKPTEAVAPSEPILNQQSRENGFEDLDVAINPITMPQSKEEEKDKKEKASEPEFFPRKAAAQPTPDTQTPYRYPEESATNKDIDFGQMAAQPQETDVESRGMSMPNVMPNSERPKEEAQPNVMPAPQDSVHMETQEASKPSNDFSIPQEQASKKPKEEKAPKPPKPKKEKKKKKKKGEEEQLSGKFHTPGERIRARFLDGNGGVDLIPTAARTRSWSQIVNLLFLTIVGSAMIVAIFYGALFVQEQNVRRQQENSEQAISDLEEKILEFDDLNMEISASADQIMQIHEVLNRHIYWSNFFELLEKHTVAEVRYNGLSAGVGGALTLEAAGPDFDSVARQLKVFQSEEASELIDSVDISGATLTNEGVTFSAVLVLNPNLFYYSTFEE